MKLSVRYDDGTLSIGHKDDQDEFIVDAVLKLTPEEAIKFLDEMKKSIAQLEKSTLEISKYRAVFEIRVDKFAVSVLDDSNNLTECIYDYFPGRIEMQLNINMLRMNIENSIMYKASENQLCVSYSDRLLLRSYDKDLIRSRDDIKLDISDDEALIFLRKIFRCLVSNGEEPGVIVGGYCINIKATPHPAVDYKQILELSVYKTGDSCGTDLVGIYRYGRYAGDIDLTTGIHNVITDML